MLQFRELSRAYRSIKCFEKAKNMLEEAIKNSKVLKSDKMEIILMQDLEELNS